jgi:ribonuclease HI
MTTRKDFEIFLYKNKLNTTTLIEVIENLSTKTIELLKRDLETKEEIHTENNNNVIYVFTDGNCKNNGKEKSKGGYGVFFTNDEDSPYYELNTVRLVITNPTNQKSELMALEKLFSIISENDVLFDAKKTVIVCTDSMYSINCIEKWSKNWLRNNWKTAKGEEVKNADIIKSILSKRMGCKCKVEFRHVRSHMAAPKNTNTIEYKIWQGNYTVDGMINKLLLEEH